MKTPFGTIRHLAFAFSLAAALLSASCAKRELRVADSQMEPNLSQGDRIAYERLSDDGPEIRLWQIVVAKEPASTALKPYRVAALPGERVRLDHHGIRVDGNLRNPQIPGVAYRFEPFDAAYGYRQYSEIPQDSYFLICDNVAAGRDSRHFGAVSKDRIAGVFVSKK